MKLIKVEFHSNTLEVEPQSQSIVIKDICNNLGIGFASQFEKLKSDPTYQSKLIKVQTNGGMQEVFTIPLSKLNGWLFSINPNRVKPEVRQKLIEYKNECFDVLYKHFNKPTKNKNAPYIHQLERENIELKRAMNRLLLTGSPDEELFQLKVKHRATFPIIIEFFKRVEKKAKIEDAECYLVDIKNLLEREAKKINEGIMLGDMTVFPANMLERDEEEHFKHLNIIK